MLFLSIHGYTFEIKLELLILQIKGPTDCLPEWMESLAGMQYSPLSVSCSAGTWLT